MGSSSIRYKYNVEIEIEVDGVERVNLVRDLIKSAIPNSGYKLGEWDAKTDKEKRVVIVRGVLPEIVITALDKGHKKPYDRYHVRPIPLNELVDSHVSATNGTNQGQVYILEGKIKKLESEVAEARGQRKEALVQLTESREAYLKIEGEVLNLRKGVVADKESYEARLKEILSSKEQLKDELNKKIESLEKMLTDSIENPLQILLYGMQVRAEDIKKRGDVYNKKLNFISFAKKAEEKGIKLTDELLNELLKEHGAENFEKTNYFKTQGEAYEKAKRELEFLMQYDNGKKFEIPEHLLKEMIDRIDKTKNTEIVSTVEATKELYQLLKESNFEIEKFQGEQKTEKLPYLMVTSFSDECYSLKVIAPVAENDNSLLAKMVTEHLKQATGTQEAGSVQFSCGVNEYTFKCYIEEANSADTHKTKFKSKVRKIMEALEKLDKSSELSQAGFIVKAVPFEVK